MDGSGVVFRAGGGIEIRLRDSGQPSSGNIVFRPQNLTIHSSRQSPDGDAVRLEGTVRHREFLGSFIRYAVDAGPHLILVEAAHSRGKVTFGVGDAVTLALSSDQIISLPV